MWIMNSKQSKWLLLIFLSLVWGSSFILMKRGLIGLSPFQLGSLRIVFAAAFSKSKSYYSSVPHIITHGGAREWAPSYPIVRTFRLLEALDVYRANSLPIFHYIVFKNILLKYFFLDIYFISKLPKLQTIDSPTTKELVSYFCYPYFYVSFLRLIYHLLKHRN